MGSDRQETLGALFIAGLLVVLTILFAWICRPARGAEPREIPKFDDSVGDQKSIDLGRMLAYDPRLSRTRTHSCMTCHQPDKGFSDGRNVSDGATDDTALNAPTLLGSFYKRFHFANGRAEGLEAQAEQPFISQIEMGQQNINVVVNRIRSIPGYRELFADAFGEQPTSDNLRKAIAAFQRTLISTDAPIDRALKWQHDEEAGVWQYAKQPAAEWVFDEEAKKGFDIFTGRGGCIQCHFSPDYRTGGFANNGMAAYRGSRRDQDRESISGRRADDGKFAVPTLREIQRTAPYGHAGHFPSLESVVLHYTDPPNDRNLDRRIDGVQITKADVKPLVAFLSVAFAGTKYPEIDAPLLPATPDGFDQLVRSETQQQGRRGRRGRR